MSDVIITVEHLSKRYRLGQIGATSLREGAERLWHRMRGRDPDVEMAVLGHGEIGHKKAQNAQKGKCPRITPISANRNSTTEITEARRAEERHRACPESPGQTAQETQEDRKQDLRSSEVSEPGPLRGLRDAGDSTASAIRADSRDLREVSSASLLRVSVPSVVDSSSQDLWALKDVSFEVKRGEVLGIIGRNGAGKSTLLKILTRITEPTSGRAILRGRVASLLEVGTGFHPELTGRENIFLNGAILGMRKAEIAAKFDEIVAFAEVEKFIDTPVKRYSSGMYVRLAFAVAAHLEPEILLVDEVLAVGDAGFQKKCLGKMDDVAKEGRTVLFVSHNMTAINHLCARALLLRCGVLQLDGTATDVVRSYVEEVTRDDMAWQEFVPDLNKPIQIRRLAIRDSIGKRTEVVDLNQDFLIQIDYVVHEPVSHISVGCQIMTCDTQECLLSFSDPELDASRLGKRNIGYYRNFLRVPSKLLNTGTYQVRAGASMGSHVLDVVENIRFTVVDGVGIVQLLGYSRKNALLALQLPWHVERLDTNAGGYGEVSDA